jgi:GTP-binding protein EngB required for normal cell division
MVNVRHDLTLEVINGRNLPVPSNRTPIGYYVRVFTSNNRWNTTIKAAESDCSVSWNESLNIYGLRRSFFQWLFSRTSEKIRLEIHALYESGPELVCKFETTFKQLLGHNGQSMTLSAIDNQDVSLTLKAHRSIKATPHGPSRSPTELETYPRKRNVVIFGETGSGKSSFINRITQYLLAETSNDAHGCTSTPERYPVEISGRKYVLIDTPGLNEGSAGTVPDAEAKQLLKNLLRELMSSKSDDIGLLVYFVRSTAHPRTFVKVYNKVYSGICHKRVPIILVGGWRNERDMEIWWATNGDQCNSLGMHFENYPCDPATHVAEPSGFLRNLIAKHYASDSSRS